jgi:hypothetical protein
MNSAKNVTATFNEVAGVCGSANGTTLTSVPTENLCSMGGASVVTGSGPWSWSCTGANGGTNATCSAASNATGPTITLSTLPNGAITNNATLNVSGTATDASGIKSLTVNSQAVTVAGNGSFTYSVILVSGANIITTIAIDNADNQTIDTRTITLERPPAKIGVFSDGYWYLDANQSWAWDGTPTDSLGIFGLGIPGAIPVAGDWNNDGKTEIGVVRNGNTWLLDASGNGAYGAGDFAYVFGKAGDVYVTGDWNADGKTEIGVVRNSNTWLFDASGNGSYGVGDFAYTFGKAGDVYVTGKWN